jgi:hypothetical protein
LGNGPRLAIRGVVLHLQDVARRFATFPFCRNPSVLSLKRVLDN